MAGSDVGLIGLAVMGRNLVLNMERNGFSVAVFNRTVSKVEGFVNGEAKGKRIVGCRSVGELCAALDTPRKVMLMVKAGPAVDDYIEQLLPHMEKGDIIIDGGNSDFKDTIRRTGYVEGKGFLYLGTGVSGGEEGALNGPSMMPGGSEKAWTHLKPIFQTICAHVDDGSPCCDFLGPDGAGHYVKMCHNGIEYGDMQLICEAYYLMGEALGMSAVEQRDVFAPDSRASRTGQLAKTDGDVGCRLLRLDDDLKRDKLIPRRPQHDLPFGGVPHRVLLAVVAAGIVGVDARTVLEASAGQRIDADPVACGPDLETGFAHGFPFAAL